MKWAKQAPTKNGWYFCRSESFPERILRVEVEDMRVPTVYIFTLNSGTTCALDDFIKRNTPEWAGPIPRPKD